MNLDFVALPKVLLHDHLDGGLRPATVAELAAEVDHSLPQSDPIELANWFAQASNSGSLETYLETFEHTVAVMQTESALERVAYEAVWDLARDGVIYSELRWAPEQHQRRGLSLDTAVAAVANGIERATDELLATGSFIRVRQILTAMRQANRSLEIAELAVRNRNLGVVGFDIAGPEAGFPAANHMLAFDYLASELFPVTVHAGEGAGVDSVRDALVSGRALRLGHGVRIAEDIMFSDDHSMAESLLGPVAQWVLDRGIPLEVSISSNLQTGATAVWGSDLASHPVGELIDLGFSVTLNTDNRLMSQTSLSGELELAAAGLGFTASDFEELQITAAEAAFCGFEEREELIDLITMWFASQEQ